MDHSSFLSQSISLALLSPPSPTAFCVGCVIVSVLTNQIISTGYSRELEGNTHAEECAMRKLFDDEKEGVESEREEVRMYTTMEPCSVRLSGNKPCTDRILEFNSASSEGGSKRYKIVEVVIGVSEPKDFVEDCVGGKRLQEEGGVRVVWWGERDEELAKRCLEVARRKE